MNTAGITWWKRQCPGIAYDERAPARRWLLSLIAASLVMGLAGPTAAQAPFRKYTTKDSFENVKEEVVAGVIKRGLVVDYTAHVGAMLARTAKDIGATKTIYTDAQSVQFCSATLSRRTMEADPANIAYCPYVIFVYALPDSPGVTHVGYRPLSRVGSPRSKSAIDAVNALLEGIVREAAGKK
jgi:Domain of unknown function DUF302